MTELETSLHLYQPPLYCAKDSIWTNSFAESIKNCNDMLTWDISAILGILSFGYTCGDRSLINEISRRPWLSEIGSDGKVKLEEIPEHGRQWKSPIQIAKDLENILINEAIRVCDGRKEIYILLSGGLDSRIVAGILAKLYREGILASKPIGVTWGLEESRDVVYGRMVANILGLEWIHINISPEVLMYNVKETALTMGALVSPIHFHCMNWFKDVSQDALVLAGSYGDSVGRAEFSGQHLLELNHLHPVNNFGLMRKEIFEFASAGLVRDIKSLRNRTPDQTKYVICEHEMQANYMRNMISQVMSVIGQCCSIYQMFTHPKVYSYMWSIHPALRNDKPYAELLELLSPDLARVPWARTNRAMRGKTVGSKSGLRKDYHEYVSWVGGSLYDELSNYIEPEWFASTGIFDGRAVENLRENIRFEKMGKRLYSVSACDKWLWLAAFRCFSERLSEMGKQVKLEYASVQTLGEYSNAESVTTMSKPSLCRKLLSKSSFLFNMAKLFQRTVKKIKRNRLKQISIREYPPETKSSM